MNIIKYDQHNDTLHAGIVSLITKIQQQEYDIPITYEDQPDLADINGFYDEFWIAQAGNEVVGTIGLLIMGDTGVIRKMFVHQDHRGSNKSIAQKLLHTLEVHCQSIGIHELYLGTTTAFKAAHRFYERNGYRAVPLEELPENFPRMVVDTVFYRKTLYPTND